MVPNPNPEPAGGMNGLERVNKGDGTNHQNWFNEYTGVTRGKSCTPKTGGGDENKKIKVVDTV